MFARSPHSASTVCSIVSIVVTKPPVPLSPLLFFESLLQLPPRVPGGHDEADESDGNRNGHLAARDEDEDHEDDRHPRVEECAVSERARRLRRLRAQRSSPASASTASSTEPSRIDLATHSMSSASGRSSRTRGELERTSSRAARPPTPGSRGAWNSTA